MKVDKFFRVYKQWKRKRYLVTIYDIIMKPVHDVNLTKHPKNFLKTKSKARLSILILSKADPTKVYHSPLTRYARLVKVLGFLLLKSNKE